MTDADLVFSEFFAKRIVILRTVAAQCRYDHATRVSALRQSFHQQARSSVRTAERRHVKHILDQEQFHVISSLRGRREALPQKPGAHCWIGSVQGAVATWWVISMGYSQ